MMAQRRYVRPIAWSIAAIVILAALGVAAARWGSPLKDRLAHWIHPAPSGIAAAHEAYEMKNWERAADLSRRLLKTDGSDTEALRTYARALVRLGRDGTGASIYTDRLRSAPLEPEDSFLLGLVLVRGGKPEPALEVWQKAAQAGPDHPELLDHLARLSMQLQRLDEAAAAARRLARQAGWEARGLLLLGQIQVLLDNPAGAVDALRQAFDLDPQVGGAPFPAAVYRRLLARSLLQLGRPAEAREPLETIFASTSPPGADPEANWLLSRAFLQQGKIVEASAALARAGSFRADNPLVPDPGPYVGAARCATCHAKESRSHERTRHARTFHRGPELLELPIPDHPLADPDDPKVTHTFERDNDRIQVKTRAGDRVYQTVVDYAFGIRGSYVTMIGRDQEKTYRALRLSSYPAADGTGWSRTAGDVPDSDSAENIRGEPIRVRDGVVRCVYCHVTRSRDFRHPPPETGVGPEAADAGIGCERCHGPGGNHVAAINAGWPDRAIVNVGSARAATITMQCGDCHVVGPPSLIMAEPDDPKYIRSTGVTLAVSRCYTESDGALNCLTCHDPHRAPERSAAFYEAKCLTCHSREGNGVLPAGAARKEESSTRGSIRRTTICPVNPARDCLNCHMPKIPVASLHLSLTDHYIRVRKPSKPQQPAERPERPNQR